MKTRIITMVIIVMTFIIMSNAVIAQGFWGIGFNAGSEKDPVNAILALTDFEGNILAPENGVIGIPEGQEILGQIFIKGAKEEKKFEIKWSTKTLISKENLRDMEFSPEYGWRFVMLPIDYQQNSTTGLRNLSIYIRAKGSKKDFIRVIFKITYNKSSLFVTDSILLKTVTTNTADTGNATSENIAKQDIFNKNVATAVDGINSKIANIENYLTKLSDVPESKAPKNNNNISYSVNIYVDGKLYNGAYTIYMKDSTSTKSVFRVNNPKVRIVNALPGSYQFAVKIDNQECSDWITINPVNGKTYKIAISSEGGER